MFVLVFLFMFALTVESTFKRSFTHFTTGSVDHESIIQNLKCYYACCVIVT